MLLELSLSELLTAWSTSEDSSEFFDSSYIYYNPPINGSFLFSGSEEEEVIISSWSTNLDVIAFFNPDFVMLGNFKKSDPFDI